MHWRVGVIAAVLAATTGCGYASETPCGMVSDWDLDELEAPALEALATVYTGDLCAAVRGVQVFVHPKPLYDTEGTYVLGYAEPWNKEIHIAHDGYMPETVDTFAHEVAHVLDWELLEHLKDYEHLTWLAPPRGRGVYEATHLAADLYSEARR